MPTQTPDEYPPRSVYLPLEKLDKCSQCNKRQSGLRLCAACGERIYCSKECQRADWKRHKVHCGRTDRIDLDAFYPLLACLSEINHLHADKPIHIALKHKIINSPNPGSEVITCPDGTHARLILLGEKLPPDEGIKATEKWWPTAASKGIRTKLWARLVRSNFVLPNVLGVCLALLSEIFTATYIPATHTGTGKEFPRVRLHYHKCPISDFGIVKGSALVMNQNRFAFYNVTTNSFQKGQDPDDHYWIYFTTLGGEDLFFDGCMFTFNFPFVVPDLAPYTKHGEIKLQVVQAAGHFCERTFKRSMPKIKEEKQRFSVLRNTDLHEAVERMEVGLDAYKGKYSRIMCDFMDKVAGRTCTEVEKDVLVQFATYDRYVMMLNIHFEEYLRFPENPGFCIDSDPGDLDNYAATGGGRREVVETVEKDDADAKRKRACRKGQRES